MFQRTVSSVLVGSLILVQSSAAYAACSGYLPSKPNTHVGYSTFALAGTGLAVGTFLIPVMHAATHVQEDRMTFGEAGQLGFKMAAGGAALGLLVAGAKKKIDNSRFRTIEEGRDFMAEAKVGFGQNVRTLHESLKSLNPEVSLKDVTEIIRAADQSGDLCRYTAATGPVIREFVKEAVLAGRLPSQQLTQSGAVDLSSVTSGAKLGDGPIATSAKQGVAALSGQGK